MKNSNLLNRLLSYSHEKQSPQRFARYAAMLIMLLTLGVGQMWAWNQPFLTDSHRSWNTSTYGFTYYEDGKSRLYIYAPQNMEFKLYIDGTHVSMNNKEFTCGGEGCRFYSNNSNSKYVGNSGIVGIYSDQKTDNKNKEPWVWFVARPTVHIRHKWNNSGWTDEDMTDNNDGTYTYNGNYGYNLTYVGITDVDYNVDGSNYYKKFENIGTVYGNPSAGDACVYEYNAVGYAAIGSSTTYRGTLTIRAYCTITYHGNNNTSGSAPSTQTNKKAGIAMTLQGNTNSLARTGYTLTGWNTEADGTGDHYDLSATDFEPNAVSIDLYAEWTADTYTAANNIKNTSGTGVGQYTATYDATTIAYNTKPTKTGYHITGLYKEAGLSNKIVNGETALCASTDYTTSESKWNQTASRDLYVEWAADTYTISFDVDDEDRVGTATNVQANVTVTFDNNNFSAATVKVPELAGYTFGGYYTEKDGSGEQIVNASGVWQIDKDDYLDASGNWIKAANTTLYAKWTANTYTVTFNATQNGGTCATKTTTVTMGSTYGAGSAGSLPDASAPSGYRFAGWYTAATDGTKVTDAMQVTTANDHTLYAHFTEITYVYFYNNLNWGAVYVTYDPYWDVDQYGTANTNGAGNYGKIYHQMQPIEEGSPIYRDEIPSSVIASWKFNICFNSKQLGSVGESSNWVNFDSGEAIFRRDFDSYATMFVPDPTEKTVKKNSDKVTYCSTDQWVDHKDNDEKKEIIDYRYKKGYWMKYNRYMSGDAGYVIKGKWDNESNDFYFRKVTEGNSYTFTKYLPAGQTYKFRIYKHCKTSNTYSSWFIGNKDATITSSITDWTLDAGIDKGHTDWYDQLTTTIAGDYTFTVRCNTNGVLKLDVTYPGLTVDNSWYRLLYSWDDGSAHSRVCETFYRSDNGGSEWVDAFIHKASYVTSQSLKLQKYVTVSSTPTWQDVESITLPSDIITKNGIYTFRIVRNGGEEATCTYIGPFEGTLFLRSDVTAGGWDYYPHIAFSGTQDMTYSEYSAQQKTDPYSHYYCKYIDNATQNVAFTIATYNTGSICDTLVGDDIIGAADNAATKYKHLPSGNPANIRFMYNDSTNTIKRAYLKSAQGSGRTRFLVLHGNTHVYNTDETDVRPADSLGLQNDEFIFIDRGNWVYELNFKASPIAKAKVIAQYNGTTSAADRYLVGGSGDTDSDWKTILGAPSDDLDHKYALAATYDFKTNRLMVAWTPDGTDITAKLSDIDMLWVRVGDGAATQINFGEGGSLSKISAVGAIKINWSDVNGRVGTWNEYTRTYAKYFVSFPFDVNVSDIFGLNGASMGREYVIQKYNGARRAQDGLFLGDDATFWENLTMDSTMHANEGYLVMFDNDYLNYDYSSMWNNNKGAGKYIYMYFPAAKQISSISNAATNTIVAPHQSERKEYWTVGGKTYKMSDTDSHWNLIGGPFFHNATISSSTPGEGLSDLHAYYRPKTDNTWEACVLAAPNEKGETINNAFKAMSCIMVQWHGTLTWNTTSTVPAFISARNMEEKKNYLVQLDLTRGEEYSDHAFVDLQEGANSDFVLCEDMMKVVRGGLPNVYVYAGAYDVAYSQVPVENQAIPVGVIIPQDGTYTFTMPTNFSGTVTLIDTYAQTRTNLALEDYEIYLENGTINDRFFLEININKVPTAIDGVSGEGTLKDGKAHKFIMNDMMYILKDGVIYDARGNRVK